MARAWWQRSGFIGGLSLALIVYNSTIQLIPGYTALYVPLNLAATALVVLAARRAGLEVRELALTRDAAPAGLAWGAGVTMVAGAGLLVAVIVPVFHPLLEDERVGDIGYGLLAYRALVRIPLGTVLLEEVAFRGVLFGAWNRWAGTRAAVVGSSLVFGVWHIRPAFDLLRVNDVADTLPAQVGLVAVAVVLTAVAGVLFCLLRIVSRSLIAPILAHAGVNSLATLAAYVVINT